MTKSLLLDTNTFLWAVLEPHKPSPAAGAALADPANRGAMSVMNVWDVSTKSSTGKLPMPPDGPQRLRAVAESTRFAVPPVTVEHAFAVHYLSWHHRDPLDRLLVAQAMVEGMTLVSHDAILSRYGMDVLW